MNWIWPIFFASGNIFNLYMNTSDDKSIKYIVESSRDLWVISCLGTRGADPCYTTYRFALIPRNAFIVGTRTVITHWRLLEFMGRLQYAPPSHAVVQVCIFPPHTPPRPESTSSTTILRHLTMTIYLISSASGSCICRWILKNLGDDLTEADIDDMIADVDTDGSGWVDYNGQSYTNYTIFQLLY